MRWASSSNCRTVLEIMSGITAVVFYTSRGAKHLTLPAPVLLAVCAQPVLSQCGGEARDLQCSGGTVGLYKDYETKMEQMLLPRDFNLRDVGQVPQSWQHSSKSTHRKDWYLLALQLVY